MALNKYMHPRNTYKTRKPDFKALSTKFEYFKEKVKVNESGMVILDFKDPAALRALTRALLEDDFGLVVTLPLDRLIPTVPQRLNYILWLEDIIGKENGAKGIDIGTGSSCIYPLLGCRLNKWSFIASEIDDQNIHFATKNIANNKMEDKITIKKVSEETLLIGLIDDCDETFDFSMCNPPFYSDHLEAQGITATRNDDRSESSSISTASESESIAWGGEVRFVTQMIDESIKLKNKVRVYTSLLGKKTSLSLLKDVLQRRQIPKYASTEFCQGRTMRWGLAWTFDETVDFPKSSFKEQKTVKPPLQVEIPRSSAEVVGDYTVQSYTWYLIKQLEELQIKFFIKHSGKFYSCFVIQAQENTWSHQRRKRRHQKQTEVQKGVKKDGTEVNAETKAASDDKEAEFKQSAKESIDKEGIKDGSLNENKDTKGDKRKAGDQDAGSKAKKVKVDSSENDTEGNTISCDDGKEDQELRKDQESSNGKESESNRNIRETCDGNTDVEQMVSASEKDLSADAISKEDKNALNKDTSSDKRDASNLDSNASNTLVRKDVIAQFWKEQMENSEREAGKKKEKSFYETLEPFNEEEKCLLLSKIVIRKDEGVISFSMAYIAGQREAMHQIMQYFKNKLKV